MNTNQYTSSQLHLALFPIYILMALGLILGFNLNYTVSDVILIEQESFILLQITFSIIITCIMVAFSYQILSFDKELRSRVFTLMPLASIFFAVMLSGPLAYINSTDVSFVAKVSGRLEDIYETKSKKGTTHYKALLMSDDELLLQSGTISGLNQTQYKKWKDLIGKDVSILIGRGLLNKQVIISINQIEHKPTHSPLLGELAAKRH